MMINILSIDNIWYRASEYFISAIIAIAALILLCNTEATAQMDSLTIDDNILTYSEISSDSATAIHSADSSEIRVRYGSSALSKFADDNAYRYNSPEREDLLSSLIKWFFGLFSDSELSRSTLNLIFNIIKYALIAIFVLALIYTVLNLSGVQLKYMFKKKKGLSDPEMEIESPGAPGADWLARAAEAAGQGRYRYAVRFLFLHSIKLMGNSGIVKIAEGKTNYQYMFEIQSADLRRGFSVVRTDFDYIWYGGFALQADEYEVIHSRFMDFYAQIGGNNE